jgi:hypothetical protein
MAGADAGEEAAHACLGRARQQDGADGLGTADQEGRLQSSSRGLGVNWEGVQRRRGRRRVWHNSQRDGAGRASLRQSAIQARMIVMVPVCEIPYWPAAMALLTEAGQITASHLVPKYPKLPLASEGGPQMSYRCPASCSHKLVRISRNAVANKLPRRHHSGLNSCTNSQACFQSSKKATGFGTLPSFNEDGQNVASCLERTSKIWLIGVAGRQKLAQEQTAALR